MLIITMLLWLLLGTPFQTAAAAEEVVVHLVDLSQSTGGHEKNLSALIQQLQSAGKNDRIIVVGFGKNAQVLLKVTMPSKRGPRRDGYLIQARQRAVETLQRNLKDRESQLDRSSTDILGALLQAQRILEESGASVKRLYLYSDMLDTTTLQMEITTLSHPESHQRYLQKAAQKHVILPQLEGAEIVLFTLLHEGQWRTTQEREIARRELRAVWGELFRQSRGQKVSWHTVD